MAKVLDILWPDLAQVTEFTWRNLAKGVTTSINTVLVKNVHASSTATLVRLGALLAHGAFTGGTDAQGQEALDEKWLQAKLTADSTWKPIGGPYGLEEDGDPLNYLDLPDLVPGASVSVDVRVVIPVSPSTDRMARVRLVASCQPYPLGDDDLWILGLSTLGETTKLGA